MVYYGIVYYITRGNAGADRTTEGLGKRRRSPVPSELHK